MPEHNPAQWFKALADETRCRIVALIATEGELCVCELMCALGESQPKISRHLALLRSVGLLMDHRRGQWVYYHLPSDLPSWVQVLVDLLKEAQDLNDEHQRLMRMGDQRPMRQAISCCP
jgi:ArsR family transcriptional regulator